MLHPFITLYADMLSSTCLVGKNRTSAERIVFLFCSLEFISFDFIYIMAGWLPDPYTTVAALSVA